MKGPKVVLVGANSVFFGRKTIRDMVMKENLSSGTLSLVDLDRTKLAWMGKIARRAIEAQGVALKLEIASDYRKVLKGADFVILAFANNGVGCRGIDVRLSGKHGMPLCSGDTIGPGGILRTLREVPLQHAILEQVRKLCPDAWVINWVNPTSAMGIAMMRYFPDIKSLAICDGPVMPRFEDALIVLSGLSKSMGEVTDEIRRQVKIRCGGINHFTWLVEMTYRGKDIRDRIRAQWQRDLVKMEQDAAMAGNYGHPDDPGKGDPRNVLRIALQLQEVIGYTPTIIAHTQEYVPFFQGHDVDKKKALRLHPWNEASRWKWMRAGWKDMQDLAEGRRPIQGFLENTPTDHAMDIIDSMWSGKPRKFYINTPNKGAITNMMADAYVEVPCVVDMHQVSPLPFGVMPRPLVGFMHRILDEHELAVEAAMKCDRNILRQAFLASPVAVSIPDVESCMKALLIKERPHLPSGWFK